MNRFVGTLAALPVEVMDFISKPVYVLGVLLGALLAVFLVKYLVYDLPRKRSAEKPAPVEVRSDAAPGKSSKGAAPVPNEEDAKIAAAIAASMAVMEDRALVAAITAAVKMYLEAENGGTPLKSGFRVVSFSRRGTGSWNRR